MTLLLAAGGCGGCEPPPVPRVETPASNTGEPPARAPAAEQQRESVEAVFDKPVKYLEEARKSDREPIQGVVTEQALRDMGLSDAQVRECAAVLASGQVRIEGDRISLTVPPKDGKGGTAINRVLR
jgi:hypothetical protein